MKKRIGITVRFNQEENKYYVNNSYIDFLNDFNIEPVYLYPNFQILTDEMNQCDLFLIPGGSDIDSKYYHEPLHEKSYGINEEIDCLDMSVIKYCEQNKKPLFGICRGMQAINIYFNGSMYQHVENHSNFPANQKMTFTKEDSFFCKIFDSKFILGNSYHHQAVKKVGDNLTVCAINAEDNIVEALIHKYLPIVSTQWHPEKLNDENSKKIFAEFLKFLNK